MNLEIFCCSGGMAEGFRRAGVRFDAAFDADPDACDSYEANLGHRPIQIDARDVVRLARLGLLAGPVDLLVADPPCTPWSRAGKRLGTADERDMLRVTVELIRLLRPTAYLIGNVPGLDDSTNWHVVQDSIGGLAAEGYCVVDFASLDAADYGVPQHRVRPFWFGHRGGPCLQWPAPTHGAPSLQGQIAGTALKPWVTVREALAHLPPEEMGKPVRVRWKSDGDHRPAHPDEPARTLTRNTNGDGATIAIPGEAVGKLLAHARHPVSKPDAPSYTVTTKGDGRGAQGACVVGGWPWDRPATTVCTDRRLAPPGHHGKSFLSDNRGHGPNAIVLSERAAAILQGFPDGWTFAGKTKASRWSQLGQAMPPALAGAVAESIARWLRRASEAA